MATANTQPSNTADGSREVLISADSHVMEAADFMEKRLPDNLRSRAPRFPEERIGERQQASADFCAQRISGKLEFPFPRVARQLFGSGIDVALVGDGQSLLRERARHHDELKGALVAGRCAHQHRLFPGFGVGPDADDGVVREDQRFAALVAGADGVGRQRQSGDAADLNGHRRCQEEAGHGGVSVTRARKLPSFKWATTSSPGCTSLTDTAGLPQRLPSGFATIA